MRPPRSLSLTCSPSPGSPRLPRSSNAAFSGGAKPRPPATLSWAASLRQHASLNHTVCSPQQRRRNRQSDRLRRLQIDDQIELGGLLDGQVARIGALQDLVHIRGRPSPPVGGACSIRHETAALHELRYATHGRESILLDEAHELNPVRGGDRIRRYQDHRLRACLRDRGKGASEVVNVAHFYRLKLEPQ